MSQQNPLNILREDHKVVLKKLDRLEIIIKKELSSPSNDLIKELQELKTFFKKEVEIHFAQEEDSLFKEMETFIPRDGGPTGQMILEHKDMNKAKTKWFQGIEDLAKNKNDEKAKKLIKENAQYYIDTLRPHIDKEDNMLFNIAEMHLDEKQFKTMEKEFAEIVKKFQ